MTEMFFELSMFHSFIISVCFTSRVSGMVCQPNAMYLFHCILPWHPVLALLGLFAVIRARNCRGSRVEGGRGGKGGNRLDQPAGAYQCAN